MREWIFLLAVFTIAIAEAQIVQNAGTESLYELTFYVKSNNTLYDDEAKGSRYLNEKFVPAKINAVKETQLVRFNVVENTIEIKGENDAILTLSKSYAYSIALLDGSNTTYETHSYITQDGKKEVSFFEKIYTTELYALYLKERIIYNPGKKAKSSYEQDTPGKFLKGNTIFYVADLTSKKEGLLTIPKKKKNLSSIFFDQTKSVEKFIKKEKLKLDKKEDLIEIMNFYFNER